MEQIVCVSRLPARCNNPATFWRRLVTINQSFIECCALWRCTLNYIGRIQVPFPCLSVCLESIKDFYSSLYIVVIFYYYNKSIIIIII